MRLPVRSFFVLFFFFFFLPLVRPLLRVRCSESVKPERGGRFRKERFPSPAESMALCFHAPHPKPGLRPSGHEIPVPHAVSCTVTWTVGPGITNHSVCKSLDHSAFLIAIANEQQANRAYILRPASKPKKKTRRGCSFSFHPPPTLSSHDRQAKPSFTLLRIHHSGSGCLSLAINPLPHLPQFSPHESRYEHRQYTCRAAAITISLAVTNSIDVRRMSLT